MAFDLTKLAAAFTNMVNWSRTGFSNHALRLTNLENNSARSLTGRFVGSQQEQDDTMNAAPDQQTVFNSWYRFSHDSSGVQPAVPAELQAWAYNASTGAISNTTNSASFIGVVSEEKYDDYILNVSVRSTNSDDDCIGILLAWYKDPITGKEFTLSAVRSPGGTIPWGVVYNMSQGTGGGEKTIADGTLAVKWGNGVAGATAAAAGYVTNTPTDGWSGQATRWSTDGHTLIHAERTGDIIKVQTSDFQTPDTLTGLLTIDLTSDPLLQKFRGPSQYGFDAYSQQDSTWTVSQFTNPQDVIYNLATRIVYANVNGVWTATTDESIDDLGENVLLVNPDTGKSFYMKDKDNIVAIPSTRLTITAT